MQSFSKKEIEAYSIMAVTRLERKTRKNRSRANNKVKRIKFLTKKPTIKKVDVEAIKKEFEEKKNQKTAE